MRAAGSPLREKVASSTTWLVAATIVTAAGTVLALAPTDSSHPEPGDVVSYSEDRIGRPWRVIREHSFGRYVIRNGRVYAIADAHEIKPYAGLSEEVTLQMVGERWRHKVVELKARPAMADVSGERR